MLRNSDSRWTWVIVVNSWKTNQLLDVYIVVYKHDPFKSLNILERGTC